MSINLTLDAPASLLMFAQGVQLSTDAPFIHVSYRFNVNGTPRGHTDLGELTNIVDYTTNDLYDAWALHGSSLLGIGSHTIAVDSRQSTGSAEPGIFARMRSEPPPLTHPSR